MAHCGGRKSKETKVGSENSVRKELLRAVTVMIERLKVGEGDDRG